MKYKIIYYVGEDIGIKTKALSGELSFKSDSIFIQGEVLFNIPYSEIKTVELFRLHGTGRMLKLVCLDRTLFVSVIRLNVFECFVIVNFFATKRLFEEIQTKTTGKDERPLQRSSEQKVDIGFCFSYANLSYRRKFIRTIWLGVLGNVFLIFIYFKLHRESRAVLVLCAYLVLFIFQLAHNYYHWKQEEKNKT